MDRYNYYNTEIMYYPVPLQPVAFDANTVVKITEDMVVSDTDRNNWTLTADTENPGIYSGISELTGEVFYGTLAQFNMVMNTKKV